MRNQFKLLFIIFWLLIPFSTIAQEIKLRGAVLSQSDHAPLPGATVSIKGTTSGALTDADGNFSINLKSGNILIVSFVGYQSQSYAIHNNEFINIELKENIDQLNEVVVTALGINKEKKSLGYAVQEIKSESISAAPESNLVNSLAGKIAGVSVTSSQGNMGSSRIVIRGETSISGNNQPLFIVDGVPVDNSQLTTSDASRDFANAISDINSEDIESISVLKGPNAAALYGSRAASGVILIKTKTGRGQKKFGISAYSKTTFESTLILPTYQNGYGQGSGGTFSYLDGKGSGINDGVDESWGPPLDGRLIPQFNSNGIPVPFIAHPNNVKDFFETGHTLNNGIAITGSDDKFDYRFSYNNTKQTGILPNTDLGKNSFGVNNSYKILPDLVLSTSANYINNSSDNLPGVFGRRATSSMLQFAWFGRQVDVSQLKNYRDANGNLINWNNSYYSNLYFIAHENTVSQRRDRLFGNVNLNYKFLNDFTANFRIGNDYYNDRRKIKIAYGTNGTPFGSYQEIGYAVNERNIEFTMNYNKKINKDFTIDILGGGNLLAKYYEENNQKAPRLAVRDVYTLTNSRDPLVSSNYFSQQKKNSAYASSQINFRNYAFLNLTARNDWSSTLPKDNNSYFYPSANASLVVSQLFDIKSDLLSFLKIRGGWSKVGKDSNPYQLLDTYPFNAPFGSNPLLTVTDASLNANLKPETTTSSEIGAEIGLLNNNVHIDLSYYNTNSADQILNVDVSPSTGYSSKLLNAGKINNQGFEVQLSFSPVKISNGLTWNVVTNFSSNKSEVLELDKEGLLTAYRIAQSGNLSVLAAIGLPYGSLFGTAYKRNTNGEIIVKANGTPDTDPNNKFFGSFQPKWIGGITNTFNYKNFSLSFLIDAKIGGYIYDGTNATGTYTGVLAQTLRGRDEVNGGLPYYYPGNVKTALPVQVPTHTSAAPGSEVVYHDGIIFDGVNAAGTKNTTILPAQTYWKSFNSISEANVFDASFVKFREINIGYNLPSKWAKTIGAQSVNVALIGRDLWILYKNAPNIDPETALNTGNGQGLESLQVPSTRSYGFSINLKF
ncbi:MAG: SusC/RagA family TonB-linked outer membrane protein [Mariniphaga sp.]|nr:SusC/RagA family TonB-linked outer membrane protein [Mariniphaga sp.]